MANYESLLFDALYDAFVGTQGHETARGRAKQWLTEIMGAPTQSGQFAQSVNPLKTLLNKQLNEGVEGNDRVLSQLIKRSGETAGAEYKRVKESSAGSGLSSSPFLVNIINDIAGRQYNRDSGAQLEISQQNTLAKNNALQQLLSLAQYETGLTAADNEQTMNWLRLLENKRGNDNAIKQMSANQNQNDDSIWGELGGSIIGMLLGGII